jgi:DNA helicase HerA-like ATPase
VGEARADLGLRYGNIAPASIGAIQRRLLVLEGQGGDRLFGEPALDLSDLFLTDETGAGRINILAADKLMASPRLYATFLLWLLSELFEELPEVGDPDKPKLVFFFDEAHLLFDDAPKALVDKVEQVARLIRSKGVGVYFVTQNPADVPEDILGQLGNRVQHALRAYTAKDRQDLKQAAQNYRDNPRFDIEDAIREVGTGEAVTSLLERKGVPGVAERTLIRPPSSHLGPIPDATRAALIGMSPLAGKYDTAIDRESAFEILQTRAAKAAEEAAASAEPDTTPAADAPREFNAARRYSGSRVGSAPSPKPAGRSRPSSSRSDSVGEAFAKSFARQLGTQSGRALVRGVLGGLFRSR